MRTIARRCARTARRCSLARHSGAPRRRSAFAAVGVRGFASRPRTCGEREETRRVLRQLSVHSSLCSLYTPDMRCEKILNVQLRNCNETPPSRDPRRSEKESPVQRATVEMGEAVFPQCGILGVTPSFVHRECRGHSYSWHCSPLSDDAMDDAQKALDAAVARRIKIAELLVVARAAVDEDRRNNLRRRHGRTRRQL